MLDWQQEEERASFSFVLKVADAKRNNKLWLFTCLECLIISYVSHNEISP